MGTFDYLGTRAVADKLIHKFGMQAVLRRAKDTPTDRPCWVVVVDYMATDKAADLANPVDRKIIMSATGLDAEPPDNEQDLLVTFVQPGGTEVDEVLPMTCPVNPVKPAGVTVVYEFTVRR